MTPYEIKISLKQINLNIIVEFVISVIYFNLGRAKSDLIILVKSLKNQIKILIAFVQTLKLKRIAIIRLLMRTKLKCLLLTWLVYLFLNLIDNNIKDQINQYKLLIDNKDKENADIKESNDLNREKISDLNNEITRINDELEDLDRQISNNNFILKSKEEQAQVNDFCYF